MRCKHCWHKRYRHSIFNTVFNDIWFRSRRLIVSPLSETLRRPRYYMNRLMTTALLDSELDIEWLKIFHDLNHRKKLQYLAGVRPTTPELVEKLKPKVNDFVLSVLLFSIVQDYTFKENSSLLPNKDQYTNCFEAWFFNAWGIKQRCCYRWWFISVDIDFEKRLTVHVLYEKGPF